MDDRTQVIDRLRALELDGGSHENLSAIARAILPDATFGWTVGACERLRDTLVALIGGETRAVVRDGGITDELREWAMTFWGCDGKSRYASGVLAIADRIDAEHERACKDAHEEDYSYSDGFDDGLCAQVSGMSDERSDECLAYVSGEVADRLKAENFKLREQSKRLFDKTLELATENANFRERITTQKQTIQAYRDESREWREVAERVQAENAKLRQQFADVTESMGRVEERCAKLRELGIKEDV